MKIFSLINKILKIHKEKRSQKFFKKYEKLCKKYNLELVPAILLFRNNEEIKDEKELKEVTGFINKFLNENKLGISVKILVREKNDGK